MKEINYEALCASVCLVAKKAGLFIKEEAKSFDTRKVEYKGMNDLVSYVDKTAEQLIIAGLLPLLEGQVLLQKKNHRCLRISVSMGN